MCISLHQLKEGQHAFFVYPYNGSHLHLLTVLLVYIVTIFCYKHYLFLYKNILENELNENLKIIFCFLVFTCTLNINNMWPTCIYTIGTPHLNLNRVKKKFKFRWGVPMFTCVLVYKILMGFYKKEYFFLKYRIVVLLYRHCYVRRRWGLTNLAIKYC